MRFYFKDWEDDILDRIFSDNFDHDHFLFSEDLREWLRESDFKAYFFSAAKDLTGKRMMMAVKRDAEFTMNRDYDGTSPDEDSIIFESYDAAMLFKLTWL